AKGRRLGAGLVLDEAELHRAALHAVNAQVGHEIAGPHPVELLPELADDALLLLDLAVLRGERLVDVQAGSGHGPEPGERNDVTGLQGVILPRSGPLYRFAREASRAVEGISPQRGRYECRRDSPRSFFVESFAPAAPPRPRLRRRRRRRRGPRPRSSTSAI